MAKMQAAEAWMTYSIIARCPLSGPPGLGTTTFSIAAGERCEGILAGVGICKTQANVNRGNDLLAIELLAQGFTPARVMQALEANDPDHAYRQIAILDRDGNGVAIRAPECARDRATRSGEVLEFRLLAALEGGRNPGGQVGAQGHLTERSAAIRVDARPDYPDIDVQVDLHDDAVVELRRVLEEFKRYEVFYPDRGRDPANAVTQDEFVASLSQSAQ
jgi:uncharacterized Ntn-hydrolase superfamily protein